MTDKSMRRPADPSVRMTPTALKGVETQVLQVWLENSQQIRAAHRNNPLDVEQAVRIAVDAAHELELTLRAGGWAPRQSKEIAHRSMWTPPRL
jgi:hypothetical protein